MSIVIYTKKHAAIIILDLASGVEEEVLANKSDLSIIIIKLSYASKRAEERVKISFSLLRVKVGLFSRLVRRNYKR